MAVDEKRWQEWFHSGWWVEDVQGPWKQKAQEQFRDVVKKVTAWSSWRARWTESARQFVTFLCYSEKRKIRSS